MKNPEKVFEKINFLTDYDVEGLTRSLVMRKIGVDVMPDHVSKDMNRSDWNSVKLRIY